MTEERELRNDRGVGTLEMTEEREPSEMTEEREPSEMTEEWEPSEMTEEWELQK